jgi:3-hydroxybutyryl-CoA dehydratase
MDKCKVYKYKDIEVGLEYTFSRKLTINDVNNFIEITEDRHPLHTDNHYSKKAGFNGIIAHGMLISSFVSTLIGMHLPGLHALITSQSFRYFKPVCPEDTLTIKGEVKKKVDESSMVLIGVEIKDSLDDIVAAGSVQVKLRK